MPKNRRYVLRSSLPSLNDYIDAERGYWASAATLKKAATINVQKEVMTQNRKPVNGMMDVDIYWITPNNREDADNVYFGVKFILDGLVKAKVLGQDGRKNVRFVSHKIRTIKGKRMIIVELIPVK